MKSKLRVGIALIAAGLALCGTGIWFLTRPDQYQATTRVEVHHVSPPGVFDPWFIQTEYEKILSIPVLYKVIDELSLNQKWGERYAGGTILEKSRSFEILRNKLRFQLPDDTPSIEISVIDEDPLEAAQIANLIADTYRTFKLERRQQENSQAHESSGSAPDIPPVKIASRAVPSASPIGHNRLVGGILLSGGVILLVAGIFLSVIRRSRTSL